MTEKSFFPSTERKTKDFKDKISLFDTCIPDDDVPYEKNKEYEIEIFKDFKFNVVHYTSSDDNIIKLKEKYKDKHADTIVSKTMFNQQNIFVFIQKRNISYFEYEEEYKDKINEIMSHFMQLYIFDQQCTKQSFDSKIKVKKIPILTIGHIKGILEISSSLKRYIKMIEDAGFTPKIYLLSKFFKKRIGNKAPINHEHREDFLSLMKWTVPYSTIAMFLEILHSPVVRTKLNDTEQITDIGQLGDSKHDGVMLAIDKNTGHLFAKKPSKSKLDMVKEVPDYPAILPIVGRSANSVYFPIAGNIDLKRAIDEKELDATKKSIILFGTLLGISKLHQHGIIHYDIKLSNIFLDYDYSPIIGDFDISFYLKRKNDEIAKYGTKKYVAPEKEKIEDISYTYDAFQIGFIINEMMKDEKDESKENMEKLRKILQNENTKQRIPLISAAISMIKDKIVFEGTDFGKFMEYTKKLGSIGNLFIGEEREEMVKDHLSSTYYFLGELENDNSFLIPASYGNDEFNKMSRGKLGEYLCGEPCYRNDDATEAMKRPFQIVNQYRKIAVDYMRGLRELASACAAGDVHAKFVMAEQLLCPGFIENQLLLPDDERRKDYYNEAVEKIGTNEVYEKAGTAFIYSLGKHRDVQRGVEILFKSDDLDMWLAATEPALCAGIMDKEVIECYEKGIKRIENLMGSGEENKDSINEHRAKINFLLRSEYYSLRFFHFNKLSFEGKEEKYYKKLYEAFAIMENYEGIMEIGARLEFLILFSLKLKLMNSDIAKYTINYIKEDVGDITIGKGLVAMWLFFNKNDDNKELLKEIYESEPSYDPSYGSTLFERATSLYKGESEPTEYEIAFFKQGNLEKVKADDSVVGKLLKAYAFSFEGNHDEEYKLLCSLKDDAEALFRCGMMTLLGIGCERDSEKGAFILFRSYEKGFLQSVIILQQVLSADIGLGLIPKTYNETNEEFERRDNFIYDLVKDAIKRSGERMELASNLLSYFILQRRIKDSHTKMELTVPKSTGAILSAKDGEISNYSREKDAKQAHQILVFN